MHSEGFNGIEIHQGRWQKGEKVGYCYPSGLEKTLCKWDKYAPLVTKGLTGKSTYCTPVSHGGRWGRMIYKIIHGTTRNMYGKLRILAHAI
jgi:hypothetical protein